MDKKSASDKHSQSYQYESEDFSFLDEDDRDYQFSCSKS
jgi:hypothetical protein